MDTPAFLISIIARILIWTIFISVILSYFLPPYHPVRAALDRVTGPMLNPIRRLMPATGMIDFSPLILILLIQLISVILVSIVRSL